ncbi:dTMP kinase [Shimazuella sp. AN120528]|uniref:dTMP kinase n=1 Tax=Shimazuella soli TaxID=1892854 RepID=UPI001F0E2329|nr:dTMP kinase [Shimazuella soli]MCH5585828.1 dTMP kinase [Shimazuella soli]
MKGMFITFEGIEGVGKSTQIAKLYEYLSVDHPVIQVRDPGGTKIGTEIRKVLLDPSIKEPFSRFAELFLYAASRAQLMEQVVIPALKEGKIVLCDRFIDSTVAYQAYGAGIPLDDVRQINRLAIREYVPHRTYLLDLPLSVSQKRIGMRSSGKDRMEQKSLAFHGRVRNGYLAIAEENKERIMLIDATKSKKTIFEEIVRDIHSYL